MVPEALFSIFGMEVHLYGICISVGILACFFVYYYYTKRLKMDSDVLDFSFYVIIISIALGFLAAKLFQAVYNWIEDGYFDFMSAGITAMGGFVGGAAAFILAYFVGGHFYFKRFKPKKKDIHIKEFYKIVLVAPICIVIAHAFGRIGCLMAGCCHGTYLGRDYVVGGIWMKGVKNGWGYYVPAQLYEALFLFALFGALTYLFFHRSNITMSVYLIAYGLWRIFIEFFRGDDRGAIVMGLAPSQWMSFLFIGGGIILLLIHHFKKIPYRLPAEAPEQARSGDRAEEITAEEAKPDSDKPKDE